MSVIMVVAGFLFCSVSAYMAGLVGSSNNPVSGITIATILFAALVLVAFLGKDSSIGPVAAVMIGAVVCCAACVAGDNLQDLKAGYLVGATPWRQQVMLAIGSVSCAIVMAPVSQRARGAATASGRARLSIRSRWRRRRPISWRRSPKECSAGDLPWNMIAIGALIGVAVIVFDQILKAKQAPFRVPVLAAAIGIYLPLETMVPIFLGGLLNYLVTRTFGKGLVGGRSREAQSQGHAVRGGPDHRRSADGHLHRLRHLLRPSDRRSARAACGACRLGGSLGEWVGLALLGAVAWWMYSVGRKARPRRRDAKCAGRLPHVLENGARLVDVRPFAICPTSPCRNVPISTDPSHRAKLIVCFATVYLVWGSTYLVASIGVHALPPFLFGGIRFLCAGVLLGV